MALLNAGRVVGRDVEQHIRQGLHAAAGFAGEGDSLHAQFAGGLESAEDIGGVAGGGDAHEHITPARGAAQQSGIDLVVAVVVGDGGEIGAVAVERLGVEGRAVVVEATRQLSGEVLRVGGASAIAAEMDSAARTQGSDHHFGSGLNMIYKILIIKNMLLYSDTIGNGFCNAVPDHFPLIK